LNLRNSRFWGFIIIFLLLLSFGNVRAQDWKENWHKPALEFLGATVGEFVIGVPTTVVATLGWGYAFRGIADGSAAFGAMVLGGLTGYAVSGPVGAPLGTVLTGKILRDEGSILGAYAGGIVGTGLGLLTVYLYNRATSNVQQNYWQVIIATALLLPPICSVTGYNVFLHKSDSQSHLSPKNFPELALTVLPQKYGNKISPKIGAKVTVRF